MSRPLLYLDVDGVVNVFDAPADARPEEFEAHFTVDLPEREHSLTVRQRVGTRDRIALLEQHFELVWATTWEHRAAALLAEELGYGADWEHITLQPANEYRRYPEVRGYRYSLRDQPNPKLGPIFQHAGTRPFAWVDDEPWRDGRRAVIWRNRTVAPTLLVEPRASGGLAQRHMRQLMQFLERLN